MGEQILIQVQWLSVLLLWSARLEILCFEKDVVEIKSLTSALTSVVDHLVRSWLIEAALVVLLLIIHIEKLLIMHLLCRQWVFSSEEL